VTETAVPGIDYPELMRRALLDVVRRVLTRAAEEGLPGEHHFYLTFGTAEEGVDIPAALRKRFPEEMTIVIQHQYWNLAVDDAGFGVTLRFGGRSERLLVPWGALRAFADPSVEFGFRLAGSPGSGEGSEVPAAPEAATPTGEGAEREPEGPEGGDAGKVVDLGAFRKRSDR
jgi:hypothetical protein